MQAKRGDFTPLIAEKVFYRAQAILNRRVRVIAPPQCSRPDFPLRAFVKCHACGRRLSGSWSKGRNGRFAYYHYRGECRDINISRRSSKVCSWTNSRDSSRPKATRGL